VLPKNLVKKYY